MTPSPQGGTAVMFDGIARRYDRLNRLLSFGIDRRWRRRAVAALGLRSGELVLDLATGTADLALAIAAQNAVIGLDPSTGMLAVAARKIAAAAPARPVTLIRGEAEALPFADASFAAVSIAFGIRNVPDRRRALAEMLRVCQPGGRIVVLELSEPRRGLLARAARFHIHQLVPRIGALLSGAPEYRYLQASVAAFPPAEEFAALMREVGLVDVRASALTFGVCHLYEGRR